jgi:hypothetical protein
MFRSKTRLVHIKNRVRSCEFLGIIYLEIGQQLSKSEGSHLMLGDDMCRFPGLQDKTKQIKNRAKALKYVGQKAALKTGLSESDPMDFKTIFRKALSTSDKW